MARYSKNIAACVVIGKDGLLFYKLYDHYLNQVDYNKFIKDLKKALPPDKYGIVFDRLKIHTNKEPMKYIR